LGRPPRVHRMCPASFQGFYGERWIEPARMIPAAEVGVQRRARTYPQETEQRGPSKRAEIFALS
jgi:hypothetical protein